jgi:adenosylcobyric acid synthase
VVLEGAGSPVEINLRDYDLVNMRMAAHADAAVVLVADIERGGVFAQLIGTWELLEAHERARVIGFLINKFRGDPSLLESGLAYVRQRTGRPVLGILPFESEVQLAEEDSLGLPPAEQPPGEVDVAVLRLPGLSNFTDFAALTRVPGLSLRYVSERGQLHHPDLVVLPGTRTTLRALTWLRAQRFDEVLCRLAADPEGPYIIGLCGGFQLLGRTIADPSHVESEETQAVALELLDVDTQFDTVKRLHRIEGEVISTASLGHGSSILGYEVHHGVSARREGVRPWLRLRREPGGDVVEDGAVDGTARVYGTYVHGLFDDARFCRALVTALRRRRGLTALAEEKWLSQREFWTRRYQRLADWLIAHCDLDPVARALRLQPDRD